MSMNWSQQLLIKEYLQSVQSDLKDDTIHVQAQLWKFTIASPFRLTSLSLIILQLIVKILC